MEKNLFFQVKVLDRNGKICYKDSAVSDSDLNLLAKSYIKHYESFKTGKKHTLILQNSYNTYVKHIKFRKFLQIHDDFRQKMRKSRYRSFLIQLDFAWFPYSNSHILSNRTCKNIFCLKLVPSSFKFGYFGILYNLKPAVKYR